MLVVVASRYDETARFLVERWTKQEARLLTCEDLSVVGWQYALRGVGGVSPPYWTLRQWLTAGGQG